MKIIGVVPSDLRNNKFSETAEYQGKTQYYAKRTKRVDWYSRIIITKRRNLREQRRKPVLMSFPEIKVITFNMQHNVTIFHKMFQLGFSKMLAVF